LVKNLHFWTKYHYFAGNNYVLNMNSSFLKKALPHLIAIGLFLIVAVIYCRPALEGKVVSQSDVQQYKQMARQSFEYKEKYGRYPLWIESAFSGMPAYTIAITGQTIISFGYLTNVLTLGLPEPINYFFLACLCFYILMMVLRVDPWVATLASLAYAYSSYDPIIIATGHVTKMWAIALAPGVIASYLMLFQRKYLWGTPLLAFFFASQLITQHLQIVYYTVICMGVLTIFYVIDAVRNGKLKPAAIALGLALIAVGVGYGTSVGATLPDQEYAKETMRGGRTELSTSSSQESKNGLSYNYAFMWSYGFGETMTLVVPDAAGGGNHNSPEIGDNSKFADRATQELNMPEDQALQFANELAYWGPQPSTSGPVYLGAVICFLSIFALLLLKGWMKWALFVTIIVGIVMAWGDHLPSVNYFLFDHLPYYNKFRSPSTSLFLPQLAAPILVALALQQLLTGNLDAAFLWSKFRSTAIVSGVLVVIILGYYFSASFKNDGKLADYSDSRLKEQFVQMKMQQLQRNGQQPEANQAQAIASANAVVKGLDEDRQSMYGGDMLRSIILIALTATLLGLFLKKKIKPLVFLIGLLVLCSYDLLAVDARYLKGESFVDPVDLETNMAPTAADQQIMADPDKNFRVYDGSDRSLSSSARASNFHNSLGGYSPAKLGLYQDLIDHQLSKGNMQVYNMLNTRYFIEPDQRTNQLVAQRNPAAFGPCWLVKGIHYVKNGDEEMQALDSVNVRDTAIIQQKYAPQVLFQPVPDSTASIQLVDNQLEKIDYKFSAKTNQFAVFSEVYYSEGWDAYIDGKKTDYLRVNYLLRGMPVPAGEHTIEWRFEPHSYKLGVALTSWFSLLIYLLFIPAIVTMIKKKRV
jgi:hypothetical protein